MPRIIVITGTDTGAGKTVLTSLLARYLANTGHPVAALKPICSGGRDDARALRAAARDSLPLDKVNPWHFRQAVTPLLAARHEGQTVALKDVVLHVRAIAHDFPFVLVEGAGGLLSPLGEHFCTRELIAALGAEVIIAARNHLGVINHVRLTIEALPPIFKMRAHVTLMTPREEDASSRSNPELLAQFVAPEHVSVLPWIGRRTDLNRLVKLPAIESALSSLLH